MTDCRLRVTRGDWIEAMQPIAKLLGRNTAQEAILEPAPGGLDLSLGGVGMTIPGEGNWTLRARIPGAYLVRLAGQPPQGESVEIRVEGARCYIDSMSLPCESSAPIGGRVELPMDPGLGEVLALRHDHGPNVIEQSGLGRELAAASEQRDRLLNEASEVLAPLGVTLADLRWAVERAVRRQGKRSLSSSGVARFPSGSISKDGE